MSERIRVIDFAHFNKDRQLTSALSANPSGDGKLFLSLTGKPREVGEKGNKRITIKLDRNEVARAILELTKWFNQT